MDEELRTYLQGMEDRTAALIVAELGALHTEIKQLSARFDSVSARLTLQGGLIQSGSRAITRLSSFAENSEQRWVELLGRVELLDARVRRLEEK